MYLPRPEDPHYHTRDRSPRICRNQVEEAPDRAVTAVLEVRTPLVEADPIWGYH